MTSPTFLLVPGAGGMAWYWHRVVAELQRRGHAARAVDLPADDPAAGLDDYVDTIVDAATGIEDVVLVAQSMGGLTVPGVAARLPVRRVVFVNAMIPTPGESGGQWWGATGAPQARAELAEAQGRPVTDDLDEEQDFLHDVPAEVIASAPPMTEQSGTPFATPIEFDRWPDVPIHAVAGEDDRFFPLDFQARVVHERLGVEIDHVPGGHLVALARPVELTDRLVSYLRAT